MIRLVVYISTRDHRKEYGIVAQNWAGKQFQRYLAQPSPQMGTLLFEHLFEHRADF